MSQRSGLTPTRKENFSDRREAKAELGREENPPARSDAIAVQSMVRDSERRAMLFTLGQTLNNLDSKLAQTPELTQLLCLLLQPDADVGRAVSFDHTVRDQRVDLRLSVAALL